MEFNTKRKIIYLMLGGITLIGSQQASATIPRANAITGYCSNSGYELLPVYQADTCDAACHNNPAGMTAADSGNFEYFCPPPIPEPTPTCTDADNDGYFAEGLSCGTEADFDDNDPTAYPGAAELCNDGVDNDGNGLVDANDPNVVGCTGGCTDGDSDGFSIEGGACGPVDCDDNNSAINPGAAEICNDGIDNNCNGTIDTTDKNAIGCPAGCSDQDADGFSADGGNCGPVDCNDSDPGVNPGALEVCGDGVDNNCNSQIDNADPVCQDGDAVNQTWWRNGNGSCPTEPGNPGDVDPNPGVDPGEFVHPYGWTNPTAQHDNYLDENGVEDCVECHSIDPADQGTPTSCFNCHGQEWDTPDNANDDGRDSSGEDVDENRDSDRQSRRDRRDRSDD